MNVKLLGLEIDEELSFSEHITTVCKQVSQRIGLLKKIMNYLPLKQRLLYYNALIRPVINYASVLWTNCDKESLGRVLKPRLFRANPHKIKSLLTYLLLL